MWTEILFLDRVLPAPPPPPPEFAGAAGAWAEFHGLVRAEEKGARIAALRYEMYEPLARRRVEEHCAELGAKHSLLGARFWHRHGVVPAGEAAVYAAVAARHRAEAFAALAELLERLKTDVPIWKTEAIGA